ASSRTNTDRWNEGAPCRHHARWRGNEAEPCPGGGTAERSDPSSWNEAEPCPEGGTAERSDPSSWNEAEPCPGGGTAERSDPWSWNEAEPCPEGGTAERSDPSSWNEAEPRQRRRGRCPFGEPWVTTNPGSASARTSPNCSV